MALESPVNGETFIPQLLVDYLTAQRAALQLPADLTLIPAPGTAPYNDPSLTIATLQFTLPDHDQITEYDIGIEYQAALETPVEEETPAQATARRTATLRAENILLACVRHALALKANQPWIPDPTDHPERVVMDLFTWMDTVRVVPAGEDGWRFESIRLVSGGITYVPKDNNRLRVTTARVRFQSNEFAY